MDVALSADESKAVFEVFVGYSKLRDIKIRSEEFQGVIKPMLIKHRCSLYDLADAVEDLWQPYFNHQALRSKALKREWKQPAVFHRSTSSQYEVVNFIEELDVILERYEGDYDLPSVAEFRGMGEIGFLKRCDRYFGGLTTFLSVIGRDDLVRKAGAVAKKDWSLDDTLDETMLVSIQLGHFIKQKEIESEGYSRLRSNLKFHFGKSILSKARVACSQRLPMFGRWLANTEIVHELVASAPTSKLREFESALKETGVTIKATDRVYLSELSDLEREEFLCKYAIVQGECVDIIELDGIIGVKASEASSSVDFNMLASAEEFLAEV
ncbi:hypothetical protein [uncultured Umboniibacter sp.]|uniref:hypothetical protein n=1 Tax=uncultured Umboniibacter sp. TaxID=1798917 RepID=UPI00261C0F26|nr:hypothetical protein [uncultured Umboniibacter sp.]